jgi:hypothetical protein
MRYEFKVVPAPRRGEKARGAKTTEDRFALAMTTLMNRLGQEGWDYVRADTLPVDERSGLTGVKTSFQNMLVFRRTLVEAEPAQPVQFAPPPMVLGNPPSLGRPLGAVQEAPLGAAPALGPATTASMAAE